MINLKIVFFFYVGIDMNVHLYTLSIVQITTSSEIGPKLKFYLLPLTRLTLKKRPYSKKFISIFKQDFFFKISLQAKTIVQCKQCYL